MEGKRKKRKPRCKPRVCAICGRVFTPNTNYGKYCSDECRREGVRKYLRDRYARTRKVPDGVRRGADGRLYEHKGTTPNIYWTGQMLSDLKRWYATTRNTELAECLGVSLRTLIRKARELGLVKDPEWLKGVWRFNGKVLGATCKRNGGCFKKGHMPKNPFPKNHQMTPEQKEKQKASLHRWRMANPTTLREIGRKAWETRRRRAQESAQGEKTTTTTK